MPPVSRGHTPAGKRAAACLPGCVMESVVWSADGQNAAWSRVAAGGGLVPPSPDCTTGLTLLNVLGEEGLLFPMCKSSLRAVQDGRLVREAEDEGPNVNGPRETIAWGSWRPCMAHHCWWTAAGECTCMYVSAHASTRACAHNCPWRVAALTWVAHQEEAALALAACTTGICFLP